MIPEESRTKRLTKAEKKVFSDMASLLQTPGIQYLDSCVKTPFGESVVLRTYLIHEPKRNFA
jgi:hypothetical protein